MSFLEVIIITCNFAFSEIDAIQRMRMPLLIHGLVIHRSDSREITGPCWKASEDLLDTTESQAMRNSEKHLQFFSKVEVPLKRGVCVYVCVGGWVVPQCMKLPYWSYCLISLSSPGSLHRFRQRSFPALLGDARDWLWNIWHEKHEFYHQLKASLLVRNKSMNQKENKTWTNTLVL